MSGESLSLPSDIASPYIHIGLGLIVAACVDERRGYGKLWDVQSTTG